MVQRIDYAVFTDVREQELLGFSNRLLGHIQRSSPTFKELREYLREANVWDKEATPVALELLDVRTGGGKVALGPFAQQLFALDDDEGQKALLFKRLLDQNTLLVKYVFEALDMEGGGRLHSTYELHRMLTSYVYPGKHVRLTDFQAWIKWVVASGRLKLVGIRWGLTDLGKEALPKLRAIDVEEFLEDEALEGEGGASDDTAEVEAPPTAPTVKVPAVTAPAAEVAAAAAAAAVEPAVSAKRPKASKAVIEAPPEEEMLDLPPEAPPVDEAVFAQYQDQIAAEPVPEAAPSPPRASATTRPSPTLPARRVIGPETVAAQARVELACLRDPPEAADVVAQLREIGRERGLGGGSLLAAYGLETRMAHNEAARHLFLAALLARLFAARPDGGLATMLVERVGALAPVAILLERPEALAEVIVRWGLAMPDPASQQLRAIVLDAVIGGRALATRADLPTLLAETPTSEMLMGQLSNGLLRGAGPLASLWLTREMVRVGLWSRPTHTEIAAFPTRALRLMAYRLRLIDSHHANSSARLLEIARRLAALLPPGSPEAAAAEQLAPDDHLRFDCARVPICQEPCALHRDD